MEIFKRIKDFVCGKQKKVKKDIYTIEHYPVSGRYYPLFHGDYLSIDPSDTDSYTVLKYQHIEYAEYGKTEQEARDIIKIFRERNFKIGVKKIVV